MNKSIRILIVEDDPDTMSGLVQQFRERFGVNGYEVEIHQASTVQDARSMARQAGTEPFDLVSLDVNLGDPHLTGLDVLNTLRRFGSAWMVALLTGVETDESLNDTLGVDAADSMRKQLRRDAYARFPSERLQVIEKPSPSLTPEEILDLYAGRLEQIVLIYEEISRLRYVFRPIEVSSLARVPNAKGKKGPRKFVETTSLHWQIRFNCGEMRTLPNLSGFKTLHYLLSRDWEETVTPEETLAIEPKVEKRSQKQNSETDPVAEYFEAQGIDWAGLDAEEQGKLIRAALSLKFNRYRELRGFEDDEDLSPSEESELQRITGELGPLADAAETAYQRLKPGDTDIDSPNGESGLSALHQDGLRGTGGGNYERSDPGRRGKDSPAAQLFRARMKRVRDCLRENGFAEMATHLEHFVMSTGANWAYHPPGNVQWTTS